jgi:DNA primase
MADGWTLDDALNFGQGTERPFRCPEHDDTNASASVNVLKGVWVCYACQASGTVKDKKAPTAAQLAAMLNPEQACRIYPESWLDLFNLPRHWGERFPGWVCYYLGLGDDPFTGDATFPVRTPEGKLAGIGRRMANPEDGPRYKYPTRWSASRTMGGYDRVVNTDPVGILVEGYADMASCREFGSDTFAVFGSGLHAPQVELVRRTNKKVWLLGFDMDEAGERAVGMAYDTLAPEYTHVVRVEWPEKDPADCTVAQRKEAVLTALKTVGGKPYGSLQELERVWDSNTQLGEQAYQEWLKEVA